MVVTQNRSDLSPAGRNEVKARLHGAIRPLGGPAAMTDDIVILRVPIIQLQRDHMDIDILLRQKRPPYFLPSFNTEKQTVEKNYDNVTHRRPLVAGDRSYLTVTP